MKHATMTEDTGSGYFDKEAIRWDATLADSDTWVNHQESFRRFHWFLKRALKLGRSRSYRLLDLGCGTGEASWPLWRRVASTTFCDKSVEMLRLARNKYPKGIFVRADASERLPFLDAEFDVVVSRGGLLSMWGTHLEGVRLLESLYRILRPNGYALLDFVQRTDILPLPSGVYKKTYSRGVITTLASECGFTVQAYDGTEAHTFNRILLKKIA